MIHGPLGPGRNDVSALSAACINSITRLLRFLSVMSSDRPLSVCYTVPVLTQAGVTTLGAQ